METAIQLIWQSSYDNVSVGEISKQAGVTKGSFYHYFESKADLFYEASNHYWNGLKQELDHIFSPSLAPLDQLENLIQLVVERQECVGQKDDNPVSGCPFFTAGGQAGTGEEKVRLAALTMSENAIQYNTALVRGLKAEGLLRGDPDPAQLGRIIYQHIMGLLMYGRVLRSLDAVKADLREAIYRIVDLKSEYRKDEVERFETSRQQAVGGGR